MIPNWIYSLLFAAALTLCVSDTFIKYNGQTEICCTGSVSKKLPGQQSCCGPVAYNAEQNLCCEWTLHPAQASNDSIWGCCYAIGTEASKAKVYNAITHQCCNGSVLEKPEAGAMYECCAGQLYTTATHRCCNDSIMKLESGFDCCGNMERYDTLTKICCRAPATLIGFSLHVPYKLHDKDGLRKCCGVDLYDPQANYCCNKTVFPLPKDEPDHVDRPERCCGNEIQPRNITFPLCFRDHWWERNSTDYHICGDKLFDFKQEICCGNQTLSRVSGMSCCWGAGLPYDPKTQSCCGSQIETLSKEDLERGVTSCCIK